MNFRQICGAGALALAIVALVPTARADMALKLSSGGIVSEVHDNLTGDIDPRSGILVFSGTVGSWTVNVSTATSSPPYTEDGSLYGGLSSPLPHLDLNSFDNKASNSEASTLQILFSINGLLIPTTGMEMRIGGTAGRGATLAYNAYFDKDTNKLFEKATQIGSLGPYSGAFSGTAVGSGPSGATLYSLTEEITIAATVAGSSNTSFDAELQALPEPASILLLGISVIALSTVLRKKSRV